MPVTIVIPGPRSGPGMTAESCPPLRYNSYAIALPTEGEMSDGTEGGVKERNVSQRGAP
jgi:hypothetical protein